MDIVEFEKKCRDNFNKTFPTVAMESPEGLDNPVDWIHLGHDYIWKALKPLIVEAYNLGIEKTFDVHETYNGLDWELVQELKLKVD